MLIRVEFQFAIGNRQNDAQESYEISRAKMEMLIKNWHSNEPHNGI